MNTSLIIRSRREELGLTMKELAVKVGVSEATISRWEGGQIDAIKHKIDRLKDLYINDLIDIETYKTDLARFNEMITEIESRPRKRDFKTLEAVLRLDIPAIYKTLSEAEKRRFWRGFIDHIEAAPDRRLTVFFL